MIWGGSGANGDHGASGRTRAGGVNGGGEVGLMESMGKWESVVLVATMEERLELKGSEG